MEQLAGIGQLGERQSEDLKVASSFHAHCIFFIFFMAHGSFSKSPVSLNKLLRNLEAINVLNPTN